MSAAEPPPGGPEMRLEPGFLHNGVWLAKKQARSANAIAAAWRRREQWRAFWAMGANLVVPLLLMAGAELAMLYHLPEAHGGRWHHAGIKVTFGWMGIRFVEWLGRDLAGRLRALAVRYRR